MSGKRQYAFILCNACLAAFMGTLDSYIVNVSLPSIARDFDSTITRASLVVLAYLLSLTGMTLISGKLVDRLGLRTVLTAGYGIFIAASLLCASSGSMGLLIAARFLQGIGGAMIVISGYAIIPKLVPHDIRGWAFGYLSVMAALGVALGTPLGGIITGYSSWHWAFIVNVPIGIVAVVMGRKTLPAEVAEKNRHGRLDLSGAALSFLGIFALIFGLHAGKELGWTSPWAVAGFLAAASALALFVVVEKKSPDPILDLRIFRNRPFVLALAASMAAFMVLAGNNFILPFYLELKYGLKPQHVGLLLLIYSTMAMLVGPMAGRLSDRIHPVLLCATAMLSAALACAVFSLTLHHASLAPAIVFLFWYGVSYALFISPNNHLVMGFAAENEQGIASGVFNLFGRLSLILGVCAFETVFSAVAGHGSGNPACAGLPSAWLNQGFRTVYMGAALLCLVSFAVSVLSARRAR